MKSSILLANGEEVEVTEFDKVVHKNDGGVYLIYNTKNKKGYVGYTHYPDSNNRGFLARINYGHLWELKKNKHYNKHLQRSWNRDGQENFRFYILEPNVDKQREEFWIDKLQTSIGKFGYNKTLGGDAEIPNKEVRQKMSDAKIGKYVGEKNPNYGKILSKESRQKMSDAKTGKNHPNYGKTLSKETKQKIRETKLGEKNPMFGKTHTKEVKQRMSKLRTGEKHPQATISDKKAAEIKKLIKQKKEGVIKITYVEIADRYKIAKNIVYGISYGRTWKHIKV